MKAMKIMLFIILLVLVGALWYFQPTLKLGAGYAAKMACSCHYLQGRSIDDIKSNDLNFSLLPLVNLTHDIADKSVTATFLGWISQKATFVEGRGCIVVVDEKMELPKAVDKPLISIASKPLAVYDTLPVGINLPVLETAVDNAFVPLPEGGTRAVLVLHDGHIVAEKYADGFNQDTRLHAWSMTKSITNALVGLLVKKGQLSPEQDHLFPAWEQDDRSKITLADLLHMNSGLEWNEEYGSISDATQMLYGQPDMAAYTWNKQLIAPPNTNWVYSSGTTNLLSYLIREKAGSDEAYHQLVYEELFLPLGMHSALIEPDQSGTLVGSSYGWATARDWAKFGQLYLEDGKVDGYQLLPENWVSFSREPANGSEGTYGAQIWLQTDDATHAPSDVFMFRGFQDQRIVIIPSRRCVLVRLGKNKDKTFPLDTFIKEVLAALPGSER
jgi:CubicO group peptidase (beta-lactamase class C family)